MIKYRPHRGMLDESMEEACESAFAANGLVYSRTEMWLDSERMNMVTYTMEVLINGKQD